jgi:uncharacterized iron-regulated membrane protein
MSTFRKVNNWLHLWLGLISGIIVFIVCITGCIWVFNEEITSLSEPELKIKKEDKALLTPSELIAIAKTNYPEKPVSGAFFRQGKATELTLGQGRRGNTILNLNPYTGEVISVKERKKGEVSFFRWILNGHRFLWLPFEIGRPIVNYATLTFVVLLITGLVWWYPKKWNKSTVDKSFKIKWGASFKRVNIDLHNVFGFYALLFLLAIALTGMVWGIKWYSQGLYWVTSAGKSLPDWKRAESDSTQANKFYTLEEAVDKVWISTISKHPESEGFYFTFPDTSKPKSTIGLIVYPNAGQFYNNKRYTFDQHTLASLNMNPVYEADFAQADFGDKLRRMNYDIHVGSILGFPGKVLAFLASLIGASLPVTGTLIWWNKRYNKSGKKKKKDKDSSSSDKETKNKASESDEAKPKVVIRPKANPVFKPNKISSN